MRNRIEDMFECSVFPAVCCITAALNMDKEGYHSTAEGFRVTEIID